MPRIEITQSQPYCGVCGAQRFIYKIWPDDAVTCADCGALLDEGWHSQALGIFKDWSKGRIKLGRGTRHNAMRHVR